MAKQQRVFHWRFRRKESSSASLLALVVIASYIHSGLSICEYGSIPGMMHSTPKDAFSLTWKPLDPKCQLKDELSPIIGSPPWSFGRSLDGLPYNKSGRAQLGWEKEQHPFQPNLGPEVKQFLDQPAAAATNAQPWAQPSENITMLLFGDSTDATQEFLPSIFPHGPYFEGYTELDAPQLNIPKGFQNMQMATGKMKPDIVQFNVLLWDIARLHTIGPHLLQQETLTKDFVQLWGKTLGFWLDRIESLVPAETMLVYHNAAYPRLDNCRAGLAHAHKPLGRHLQIMQLDQVGKYVVSKRPRWHLIDYGMISESTAVDGAHLRDGIHPNSPFVIQALNIILNLYREHKLELKSKAGR